MAGNSAFQLVGERGWRRGMENLLDNELGRWWKTRRWWIQCLMWGGIIGFMLSAVVLGAGQNIDDGFMIYGVFASLGPAIAVVIVMQDAVVGEKLSGTASWILSKPASRQAFILSKLVANSLGVLVTMVLVPGIVAYAVLSIASSHLLGAVPFLGAFLVLWITQLFYLTFALMLGALLNSRGAVIGISLALLFLQQYLIGLLPLLRYALPWTLAMPLNNQTDAIVLNLLRGQPVSSYLQVAIILVEIAGFVLISLWRFEREEL